MNWLDGIIGFISPEWGARREAWRQSLTEMRNYDAGNYDRGNANWRVLNQSAEFTDRYSRDNVRARARDLERNSDMMNSVIGAYKRNVIGGGYALQAKTGSDKTNEIIQTAWKKWCKKQNCDVTGTQSFTQMMRMCVKRKKVDGGILIVKRYTKDGYLPFKLQTFEVDELDNSQMLPKKKGNKVVGGIEMNEYNKPMGYWIRQYSVDGMALSNPVYVDAKDVIFLYTKHRPSQVREMSDMSPTITRIRDANEFMIAVSVKERIAACLSVFIKKQLPTTGIGRQNGSVPGPHQDYQGKSIAPGMIKELNAGDEIQVVNPTGQATDAASYIKLQQRLVGAGQVEFDSDEDADLIYQKVKSGTLKTTSVGYQIDSWEEVMPNKQSADGRFTGPADIARKWTPYEISIVSVPADPTVGVGRELEEETEQGTQSRSTDWFERQLQINKNIINQGGNRR